MISTTKRVWHRSGTMMPIFRLRLRNGASIGPAALKQAWSLASGSEEVSVSRDAGRPGHASVHQVYIVSAPAIPHDVAGVEMHLRKLLQDRLSIAHLELTRLV